MALSTRPTKDEEEDEILDDEIEETGALSATPAISDRRRRRMIAQGLDPDSVPTATAPKGRPTPSRDEGAEVIKEKRTGNFLQRTRYGIVGYIQAVRAELLKVAWPTRADVERLTRIVLTVTAIAAVTLGLVSFIFGVLATAVVSPDFGTLAGLVTIAIIVVVGLLWLFRDRLFPSYE